MKATLRRGAASTTVDVGPDESILDALLRSGAEVAYCCRGGICGLCAATLVSGRVEGFGASVAFSSTPRLRDGEILICRSRPAIDCIVQQAGASWAGVAGKPRELQVAAREVLEDRIVHIRISAESELDPLRFRAGQHVRLEGLPADEEVPGRLFIASRPGLPYLDFYLPQGDRPISSRLAPGRTVLIGEPAGSASLREDEMHPVVVVAEKAGLASALGILDALSTYQVSRPASLVMRADADSLLARMLLELVDRACIPVRRLESSGDELAAAVEEAIVELHESTHLAISSFRGYVKGTSASIVAARRALHGRGVRPWNVHVEEID